MKTLVIDIETTGLPQKGHEYNTHFLQYPNIVTLAYKVNDGETKEYIVNQEGRMLTSDNTAIHGITTEMANASPHYIVPVLAELIALEVPDRVIGHNIYFDSSIIKAQVLRLVHYKKMSREEFTLLETLLHKDRRIDTMKSTIKFCDLPGPRGPKWPKLTELHLKLFGENPTKSHSSSADVDTTYKCYVKLLELGVIK